MPASHFSAADGVSCAFAAVLAGAGTSRGAHCDRPCVGHLRAPRGSHGRPCGWPAGSRGPARRGSGPAPGVPPTLTCPAPSPPAWRSARPCARDSPSWWTAASGAWGPRSTLRAGTWHVSLRVRFPWVAARVGGGAARLSQERRRGPRAGRGGPGAPRRCVWTPHPAWPGVARGDAAGRPCAHSRGADGRRASRAVGAAADGQSCGRPPSPAPRERFSGLLL